MLTAVGDEGAQGFMFCLQQEENATVVQTEELPEEERRGEEDRGEGAGADSRAAAESEESPDSSS
eukprot:2060535-Rhodomonas_salina.3